MGESSFFDSKRSGLDKAVYQIEQAIQRSKTKGDASAISGLEVLLERTQQMLPGHAVEQPVSDLVPSVQIQEHQQSSTPASSVEGPTQSNRSISKSVSDNQLERTMDMNNLSVNDAENPLQLLAQTSELLLTPRQLTPTPQTGDSASSTYGSSSNAGQSYTQTFFSRLRSRLDTEPELDPIEMGLITLPEAEVLFTLSVFQSLLFSRADRSSLASINTYLILVGVWTRKSILHTLYVRGRTSSLLPSSLHQLSFCLLLQQCRKGSLLILVGWHVTLSRNVVVLWRSLLHS